MIKVSVITVCYNAEKSIEKTIESIISQSYSNFEYIVIDGGSKDSTVSLIEKYSLNIFSLISEPDYGVYDAMNKGVRIANGKYVIFMNSGDLFVDSNVLSNIFININNTPDIIYGNTVLAYSFGVFLMKPEALDKLSEHMIFCHQSCFVKSEILRANPFNSNFKIAADYNLFYNLYMNNYLFSYVDIPISVYEAENGLSSSDPYLLYRVSSFTFQKTQLNPPFYS